MRTLRISYNKAIASLSLAFTVLSILCVVTTSASAQTTTTKRTWTIAEILAERKAPYKKKNPKYCQKNGPFAKCVCPSDVPTTVQYRPSVAECSRKAAVILSGGYKDVFSVVVRDRENKDRWPLAGINGCTAYERDTLALNKCSAFKVQKIIPVENGDGDAEVHCLGASGYSTLFKRVTRMTAKIADVPNSTRDPLARWCLAGPTSALN